MKPATSRWRTEADAVEAVGSCHCCGRRIFLGSGLLFLDEKPVATYWYDWSEGHLGLFSVAVHWGPESDERTVVCACACDPNGTKLSILDSAPSDWAQLHEFGAVLDRAEAMADPDYPSFFDLFDAVIETDPRLGPRVANCEHVA